MTKSSEDIYVEFDCKFCGKHEENRWIKSHHDALLKAQLCSSCHFWHEKIEWRKQNDPKPVVVDGVHYRIGNESASRLGSRGFSGSKFIIKFFDGRVVESTNLWCQGNIPEKFRDVLTDNARFIPDIAEIETHGGVQ